jgi:flagellar basal body P-ring formation protein FlgA
MSMARRWTAKFALVHALALALATAASAADDIEAPATIATAVAAAVKARMPDVKDATAEIGTIDPRLRLPVCPSLAVDLPATGTAAMTAKVSCAEPGWTIYVPIRLHAWVDAVVAATNLAPDTRLTAEQLSRGRVDLFSAAGGVVTEPQRAEGRILRVGVMAGAPILASFLAAPVVIRRGDKVLLTLRDPTMVIRASVLALEDGRIGDRIAVQNVESEKVLHATVTGDGSVEIRF